MSDPSDSSSESSTLIEQPTTAATPDQDVVEVPILRIRKDNTHKYITARCTIDGISLPTGDLDLGHVPDVRPYWDGKASWDQRLCIRVNLASHADDYNPPRLQSHARGTYYVMVCKSEKLERNTAVAHIRDACVYGDVFFFKVSEEYVDLNSRAVFEPVPTEMVSLGIARRLLEEVARGWKGGIVPKSWVNLNRADRHERHEAL